MFLAHLLAFALAAAATVVLPSAAAGQVIDPDQDPFYSAPEGLAKAKPGTVLRSREVEFTAQGSAQSNDAWQLLYRTTDAKGAAEAAVTTIVLPSDPTPRMPVVSYQTAEDSLGTQCAPSYTLRTGSEREIPLIQQALGRGWAVVAPDYEGPESQYGAGHQAGHAVLDSIRAATRFEPAGLGAGNPVGVWGYSGGALASAWAAELQAAYAPDLSIAAVAAGGVPPDIEAVARTIDGGPFAGILFGAAQGIERAYPEMDVYSVLNEEGRALWEEISDACVDEITEAGLFKRSDEMTTVPDVISLPRIQAVLEENHLGRRFPAVPIYIYHAIADQLIPIATVDRMTDEWCRGGTTVQYYRDPASEHVALVATGAVAALDFMQARFAGERAPTTCPAGTLAHADPHVAIRFVPRAFERRGRLRFELTKPARVEVAVSPAAERAAAPLALPDRTLPSGRTVVRFRRRVAGATLAPARYVAEATATDAAGRSSAPAKARFRVRQ